MQPYFKKPHIELLNYLLTASFAIAGFVLIAYWLHLEPSMEVRLRIAPPQDKLAQTLAVQKINIKGTFTKYSGVAAKIADTWSGFRGEFYDNIVHQPLPLRSILSESALPVLWSQPLGAGYAGPAVRNGCVYVLDYDKEQQSDALRCFSLATGEEIWRRAYRISIKRNHGMSRTVPAVSDKYVVTMGPKCQVLCANALTGDFKWGLDLPVQYGTEVPLWYTGQCPVIDGSMAVLAPGGKALMIGVDLETGNPVWETPNPENFKMSHSSIIPMTFFQQKMYVYCALGAMVGIAAAGPDKGKIIWQTKDWNHSVISPSPVQVPGNRIFVTAGYGGGSRVFQVSKSDKGFSIRSVLQLDKEVFACEQHTPIYYEGHLYSVLPNDAGENSRQLVCMTPEGKIKWRSGRDHRFGLGPFVIADNKIFVLDDHGVLTVVQADADGYKQLSQVKVLQGRESWAPIAPAGTKMILRDFEEMICLEMKQ
ncbi:PQQ-binding-like beta-propeller repeat protein [candidate division FCPU426 bacterium]|nr:PQQ-binding-like beta-propeller repeat protein [candidate division FCPU426 bacterium]